MTIEILSRVRLPIAPILPDELARKADIGASHFHATAPDNPIVGTLWATPEGGLSVWTGTAWLRLGAAGPGVPDGNTVFDSGFTDWDGGYTNWDA